MTRPTVHDALEMRPRVEGAPADERAELVLAHCVLAAAYLRQFTPVYQDLLATPAGPDRRRAALEVARDLGQLLQSAYRDADVMSALDRLPVDATALFFVLVQMEATLTAMTDPADDGFADRIAFGPGDVAAVLASEPVQELLRRDAGT